MVRHIFITSNLCRNFYKNQVHLSVRSMSSESDVIFESVNGAGVITLNRPKVLNSLNLSMVEKLVPQLKKWEGEKSLVIIKGAGEKAFCAGGDVKAIAEDGLQGGKLGYGFFKKEYIMNGMIGTYSIPYVALIDGICMGGGVGLSVHGPYRVATERTLFAMPETTIGLFPDVGGSYFLPRLGGKLGLYLALSSFRLKGSDVLKAGVATHYVESKNMPELEKALTQCKNDNDINDVLKKFSSTDTKEFSLKPYLNQINSAFNVDCVEKIFQNLEKDGSPWAQDTIKTLNKLCPTSLKITFKELEMGNKLNLLDCLEMEYRMAVGCLKNKNFFEGVRALLIEKDQSPKWMPATVQEVTDEIVERHFSKLSDDEELKHKL